MPDVTIVIPCAPYHLDVLARAIASVRAQTVPCEVIPVYEDEACFSAFLGALEVFRWHTETAEHVLGEAKLCRLVFWGNPFNVS